MLGYQSAVPAHNIGDTQTPFRDDGGRVPAAVVVARGADVVVLADGDAGVPFYVAVVVVGGEVVVGQVFGGIAGAPEVVHHLDVKFVVGGDAEGTFGGADSLNTRVRVCYHIV